MINISDDVEVFATPSASRVNVSVVRYDQSPIGEALAAQMKSLADYEAAGYMHDPAVPAQSTFAYLLPGDAMVAGSPQVVVVNQLLASTSRIASAYVPIARALYLGAHDTYTSGATSGQSFQQVVEQLSNPIAKCARSVVGLVNGDSTATLDDAFTQTIKGAVACRSAIKLLSVSDQEQATRDETEHVLQFRARIVGEHALSKPAFWMDAIHIVAWIR